jgi:hypothetical protein
MFVSPICNAVDIVVRDGLQEQLTINANRIQSSSRKVDDSDDSRIHIKDQSSSIISNETEAFLLLRQD